jgi:threonine/homoserine/homoserine lactone efflux protein
VEIFLAFLALVALLVLVRGPAVVLVEQSAMASGVMSAVAAEAH